MKNLFNQIIELNKKKKKISSQLKYKENVLKTLQEKKKHLKIKIATL